MQLALKNSSRSANWLCGLVLLVAFSSQACAESLEKWRNELFAARALAENDVAQAYPAAQRLQLGTPADALPADRARALNLLARIEVYAALTEQAEKHAQLALDTARQANDRPGQAEAQLNIALNSVNQARIDASVAATIRSAELLDGADRPELLGEALLRMSMMYRRLGDMDNSVTMAMQAMDIAKRSQNSFALTYAYQGMAISFEQSGHYREAYDNYRKMRDQARSAQSLMLEAHAVQGMATALAQQGDARGGENMMKKAIGMYRMIHAPFYLNFGLFGLADMLDKQGRHSEALQVLDEVVENYRKYPNRIGLWFTLNARSLNLQSQHRMNDATADALRAYELARGIGLPLYIGGSARRLSEIYAAKGDYPRAYRLSAESIEMADKAARLKSNTRMVELAERYETDSKQRLIDELKRHNDRQDANQRWLWTVLIGSAALLLLTSFFLIRLRRSRREIQQLNIGLEQRVKARTAELRQQSRYLRTLFDTLPISVWLKDTAGRYLTINTCQVALDGMSAEQMIGKSDEEIWPGEIGAAFRAADIEVMETRRRKTQELAIPGNDGEIYWREIDKAPVIDDDGTLLGTVGVGRDISERKRYEQSLLAQAKLEQRLSSVAANIPGFIFTFRAEPDGRISLPFASPGIEEMLGLSPELVKEDAGVLRARYHPDDLPRVVVQMNESRHSLAPFNIELRMYNRDNVQRWIAIQSVPQQQNDGSTEWNGIMLDITERKSIEEALRLSQEGLADAQRIAHVGSWQMNLADNALSWSDEIYCIFEIDPQQFGASYEAFISLVHPDDRDSLDLAYKASLEKRERFEFEHRLLLPDGRIKYVHERCESYYDDDGIPVRSLGTVQDITDRKLAEQRLTQALEFSEGIINAIPDILFEMDRNGRYLNVWTQNAELLAAQKQELLGKTVYDVLSDENAAAAMAAIREADEQGTAVGKVFCLDLPHGRHWFEHSLARKAGNTLSDATFMVLSRDITERMRMEEALGARERELRALAESSPGMMGSFYLRPDGSMCMPYVSSNIYDLFGLHPQDLAEDATPILARSHPEDGERVRVTIAESARTMTTWHQEFRIMHPAKGERWMESNTNPQPHPDGGTIWYGYVHDITERKLAEQKLKQALEFNEGVIGAIPDLLFEMDLHGVYLNVWTHRPELLAAQKEVLLGNNVNELLTPDGAAVVMEALGEAAENGVSFGKVIRIERPQGTNWFELSASKKTGGTYLVLSRDITARKQMEAALFESEARYRNNYNVLQSMLESSSSVSVFALDREYRYLFFNKRHRGGAKRIRGAEIAIGMNMLESIGNDEFRDFCRQGFDLVLAGNSVSVESKEEVVQDGILSYEYNENYGSPIFNDDGEVVGLTVFAINNTERKRLEAELRASRNFLDSVIDSVSDPIFVKDRQHRWTLLNDAFCAFIGKPRAALIGKSDYDFFPKEQADVFWEKDELVFESGNSNLNEEHFTTASGEQHYIQTRKTPFIAGDGRQMLVGVIRDITDLKRYQTAREAALMEAERLVRSRSEFIAQMSHELRTPLNGILGYAQILGRDKRLDERQLAGVSVIRESGEHLLALINDILDFAKIDAGKIEISSVDIQLDRFLQTIAGIIRIKADEKRLEFSCTLAPEIPAWIHADEKRLRQVLLNLLSNAVKFTEQGRVSLRVDVMSSGCLRFEVRDTGIGIEADQLGTIFQPFEQVGDQRHRHGGTGLGLPISRQFVRLMGGEIHVDSKLGQGSAFWFELEVTAAASETAAAFPIRAVTGYAGTRRTILVADDARENRAVLVQMLGELGFEVIEAEDGTEALSRAPRADLILMDSLMPKLDGVEAMRRLRRLPGCETLPVIAVSASADSRNEAHCLEAGADAFLPKPIDMMRLLAQIAALLGLEWRYEQESQAVPLVPPPQAEMQILHGLALIGNMRDILQRCDRIAADPSCGPFAERLRALAHGYQTRAILELVEQYLQGEHAS